MIQCAGEADALALAAGQADAALADAAFVALGLFGFEQVGDLRDAGDLGDAFVIDGGARSL